MRDLYYDRNALYLNCINVNILVLILHSSFARCNCQGKLGRGYAFCIISDNTCLLKIFTHLVLRVYSLTMVIQQNEPEFPGEVVDFRAGAQKSQNNPRATCGAIM